MRNALALVLSFGIVGAANTPARFETKATNSVTLPMRTWVSGVGSDASSDCSRSAPCLTFQGALDKTAAEGEINCLDPGSFGTLTITKSITIDCTGVVAGVQAVFPSNGIIVNAANDDVVILRNLEINGLGGGSVGVLFQNGSQLIIENTKIFGFVGFAGVQVRTMAVAAGNLVISNSTLAHNGVAIYTMFGNTTVSHSVIAGGAGAALFAENTGVINADSNVLTGNGGAVLAGNRGPGQTAATVRLSNNDVYANFTGFGCGGGTLASNGTNRKGSNTGGFNPVCAPNATITQQ